jgi:prepilin signal peptidase PulO-like enzyme (type II secretory pathway)
VSPGEGAPDETALARTQRSGDAEVHPSGAIPSVEPSRAMESAPNTGAAAIESPAGATPRPTKLAVDAGSAWIAAICLAAVVASGMQIVEQSPDRGFFVPTLAFLVLGTAAWLDVAYCRIPNALTYPAILIGLVANVFVPAISRLFDPAGANLLTAWLGGTDPRDGLLGFGACAGFAILSFMMRGMGGGDAKALGAFGALLGFSQAWPALFNALLIGAVVNVVNLIAKGAFIHKLQDLFGAIFAAIALKERPVHVARIPAKHAPFVLALFLGYALAHVVQLHHYIFFFM